MAVLAGADFDDVRELVADGMTAAELSDEQIGRDIWLGIAEAEVLGRLGMTEAEFKALPADQQFKGKVAIKYTTAAIILPSRDALVSQSTLDRVIRLEEKPWQDKAKEYLSVANEHVPPTVGTESGGTASGVVGVVTIEETF